MEQGYQQNNKRMSAVRVCVKRGFGKIVSLWKFLDFKKGLKVLLQSVGKLYIVGGLLTNLYTCYNENQTSMYFRLKIPSVQEYLHVVV